MGRRVRMVLATAGLAAFGGCADESREAAADRTAAAFLEDVRAADYPMWETMPGFEMPRASMSPHGQQVQVFINEALAEGLQAGPPWPLGAVVVKDGWANDRLIVRSMIRRDADGWFFAQFDEADRIIASGYAEPMCLGCHLADEGYVLSAPDAAVDAPPDDEY